MSVREREVGEKREGGKMEMLLIQILMKIPVTLRLHCEVGLREFPSAGFM